MNKASRIVGVCLIVLIVLVVACAPQAAPAPAPQAPAPAAPAPATSVVPAGPATAAWEEKWQRTLAEGKKEGKVMLSTSAGAQMVTAVVRGLKEAYGIDVEAVSGRSGEINTKILAERRAELYLWDVAMGGTTSPYTDLIPKGVLAPMDSALILPEVTDPEVIKKVWYRGELWWVDREHYLLATLMFPFPPLAINTTLVKPDEIKSYNDLLDPKWKGKMSINDPTDPGSTFASFVLNTFGTEWVRQLVKNEPIIMRDQRLQVEWLAHGKQPIALGVKQSTYVDVERAGAPVKVVVPQEGTWLSTGSGAIMAFNKQPHPNATSVFINWLLSKEGQTKLALGQGGQSTREDVPTDFLLPHQIRQPGVKYWEKERKEVSLKKAEDVNLSKELFAPLLPR